MKLPTGLLYHTLKGVSPWHLEKKITLDVAKITHVSSKKRLFAFFHRDLRYSLTVMHKVPERAVFNPVYGWTRGDEDTVTFYKNNDCAKEITEIKTKIKLLDNYAKDECISDEF